MTSSRALLLDILLLLVLLLLVSRRFCSDLRMCFGASRLRGRWPLPTPCRCRHPSAAGDPLGQSPLASASSLKSSRRHQEHA